MNEGWQCPGCGACYAPWVPKCESCSGINIVVNTTMDNVTQCQHQWSTAQSNGIHCLLCGVPPHPSMSTYQAHTCVHDWINGPDGIYCRDCDVLGAVYIGG